MPSSRGIPPIRALRRVLLVAMILVVAAVIGLFVLGRSSRPVAMDETTPAEAAAESGAKAPRKTAAGAEPTVLSEGFDYEQQVAGKPVFRLQGDRFTTDKSGKISLEGVHLELYQEGKPYRVASHRANYDPDTHNAQLIGSVQLRGGEGWAIDAERLDLVRGGRLVVSRGQTVRIAKSEELHGHARRLEFDLDSNELRLSDGADFEGEQGAQRTPFTLAADQLVWARDARNADATGRVRLTWGDAWMRAEHVHAVLRQQGGALESAVAEIRVEGRLAGENGRDVTVSADRAEVQFAGEGGTASEVVLTAADAKPKVRLIVVEKGEPLRRMTAPQITAGLVAGRLDTVRASGGVLLEERPSAAARRVVRGDQLDATFTSAGELAEAKVRGDVVLQDEEMTATGQTADLDQRAQTFVLQGQPARAKSAAGNQLNAPRIDYDLAARSASATGGVQGSFQPNSGMIPGGGEAGNKQPIHLDADGGSFSEATHAFRFQGNVQAVQGETLLFADLLEGDQASGKASASGNVKTVWRDQPVGKGDAPLTVASAPKLDYDRTGGELHYSGGVDVRQEGREIRADDVRVELDDHQQAQRLVATGSVTLQDHATGRTVEGDRADYDLHGRNAIVTGDPVSIKDKDGTVLRGRRALFDAATGSAQILSEGS